MKKSAYVGFIIKWKIGILTSSIFPERFLDGGGNIFSI